MRRKDNSPLEHDNIVTEAIIPEEELNAALPPEDDDAQTIRLDDNPVTIKNGLSSLIGSRNVQQDAARVDNEYMYIEHNVFLSVMCDGMGGLNGGEIASRLCVTKMFEAFYCVDVHGRVPSFFKFMVENIDKMVYNLTDDNGRPLRAGSTMTAVIIDGSNLFWVSVGDSRIYLKRGSEMLCLTEDHNYGTMLDKKVKQGRLTREEALASPERAALVSYIGIGGVPYIDINPYPFALQNGDTILQCSDGLYRTLSEREILRIIDSFTDMQQAADALTAAAIGKGKRHQDNTTAVLLQYSENAKFSAPFNMPI